MSVLRVADIIVKTRADRTLRDIPRRGFTGGASSRMGSLAEEMQTTTGRRLREALFGSEAPAPDA
jgi:hypothetical protein